MLGRSWETVVPGLSQPGSEAVPCGNGDGVFGQRAGSLLSLITVATGAAAAASGSVSAGRSRQARTNGRSDWASWSQMYNQPFRWCQRTVSSRSAS